MVNGRILKVRPFLMPINLIYFFAYCQSLGKGEGMKILSKYVVALCAFALFGAMMVGCTAQPASSSSAAAEELTPEQLIAELDAISKANSDYKSVTMDMTEDLFYRQIRLSGICGRRIWETWDDFTKVMKDPIYDMDQVIAAALRKAKELIET